MAKAKKQASADGSSMSEEIRQLLTSNPEMKTAEVIETLATKGVHVKKGLVYLIRSKMNDKKQQTARKERKARVASSNGQASDPVALVRKVRSLADELGGIGKLQKLLEAMS